MTPPLTHDRAIATGAASIKRHHPPSWVVKRKAFAAHVRLCQARGEGGPRREEKLLLHFVSNHTDLKSKRSKHKDPATKLAS